MLVSKSFKHLVERHVKKGGSLVESGLSAHKDFEPFVEELARNSKQWGNRPQSGFTLHEVSLDNENVHIYFKEAGQGNITGVSLKDADVTKALSNAQTEQD